jgi:hypothetical protein
MRERKIIKEHGKNVKNVKRKKERKKEEIRKK